MQPTDQKISGTIYSGGMLIGVILGILPFNRISRRVFLISNFPLSGTPIRLSVIIKSPNSDTQLIIFCIFVIILSFGLVLDYPYPIELLDIKVRGTGVGICTTISRFGAVAGIFLLPILTNQGGTSLSMLICAIVILAAFTICLIWVPETSPKFEQNNRFYSTSF